MVRTISRHSDHCALCGIPINRCFIEGEYEWNYFTRALYFDQAQAQACLTGLGLLNSSHQVRADVDPGVNFSDAGATPVLHALSRRDADEPLNPPAFGFHDECWTILVDRVAPGSSAVGTEALAFVPHLYNVLACITRDRQRFLDPVHDYGGRWKRPQVLAHLSDSEPLEEQEWLLINAQPSRVSVDHMPPAPWPAASAHIFLSSVKGHAENDAFARLPREIAVAVLEELPSVDVCSLRLASRAMAFLSQADSLPNSFWRSRFTGGFEMGFLYPAGDLPGLLSKNWQLLYRQVQHCLRQPAVYPSLWNRRRIWRALGDLSATLRALLVTGAKVCKFTSIAAVERYSLDGNEEPSLNMSPLWTPDVPRDFQFPIQEPESHVEEVSQHLLDMDFGGPRGERLSLLNRISPFLDSKGLLRGMAFFYDDGTELMFGSRHVCWLNRTSAVCLEPSIPIRGSAGERIIRMTCGVFESEAKRDDAGPRRLAYSFLTSREMAIEPCFQIETNMGIKSSELGTNNRGYSIRLKSSISVGAPGCIITALVAQKPAFGGPIEALSARYLKSETDVTPTDNVNTVVLSRDHMWGFTFDATMNFVLCSSGVHLGRVRSICFSRGATGRCRSAGDICGMLVQFWDSDHALVIGQWVKEIEGSRFEVQEEEKITEIGIHYTLVEITRPFRSFRYGYGKVIGFRFATSNGREKQLGCMDEGFSSRLVQYHDNPFEEVTGLVWNNTLRHDFIEVLRTPPPAHKGTTLVVKGFESSGYSHEDSRDLHNLVKLPWRVLHPQTGASCKLSAVDAFIFHCTDQPHHARRSGLVGLRFHYAQGQEREVGCCEAEDGKVVIESMALGDGDEISHFERCREGQGDLVAWSIPERQYGDEDEEDAEDEDVEEAWDERYSNFGVRIAFHLASGRTVALPAKAAGIASDGVLEVFAVANEAKRLDDDATLLKGNGERIDHEFPSGSQCFAGLWVKMLMDKRRKDWVETIGPLFQCEV